MNHKTKAPALAGYTGLLKDERTNLTTRPPRKCERVLAALLSGKSFNRFEAERELHDHCLHSTVSGLQRKGLVIHRRYESVPGYMGYRTEVCRYWLADESRPLAMELLGCTPHAEASGALMAHSGEPGGA